MHAQSTAYLYVSVPQQAPPAYDGTADAEALYKAMKGMGTDEEKLNSIIASRTRDQLQAIKKVFFDKYGKSLEHWIKSETSGNYEELLCALIDSRGEYDAKLIKKAVKGLGTDDDELIEVICTRTNAELKAMKEAYRKLHSVDAENDVKGDTSGDYRELLLAILKADRPESTTIDTTQAKADAQLLYSKGEGKVGTDEKTFIDILTHRSYPHLHVVNDAYINLTGHSLESAIKSETSGNFRKAMTVILTPKDEYFANRIKKAVQGAGTNDHMLIRNVNYLVDNKDLMKEVNRFYAHAHKNGVAQDIKNDTSGNYGKCLFAVCSNRLAV
jgi:Holliday junction resolvasome RuvABC endonuclease subunit